MFEKILSFLKGKVLVSIRGLSPERFLNLCAGRDLELYNLHQTEEGYICEMSLQDYRESRKLARKCHVLLHIITRSGLPFILHRNRKRKAWGIGFIAGLCLLYFMSFFLWDIQVEGNSYYTDDMLLSFLEEQDITHGMRMSAIVCDELEQSLRNHYTNITWVSAQISGTRLILSIKENFGLMNMPDDEIETSDIIAPSDGVITSLVTRSGIPMVKAGDIVTKGQVLVSGEIPIVNDAGEITEYREVAADATIRAQVTVPYSREWTVFREEKQVTSSVPTGFELIYYSTRAALKTDEKTDVMHYRITEYGRPHLFYNFYLPIEWTFTTDYTYETKVYRLSREDQQAKADAELKDYILKLENQDIKLVEQELQLAEEDFTFHVNGTLLLDVPFGENVPIVPESTEESENDIPQSSE